MKRVFEKITNPDRSSAWKDRLFLGVGALGLAASALINPEVASIEDNKEPYVIGMPMLKAESLGHPPDIRDKNEDQSLETLQVVIINNPEVITTDDVSVEDVQREFQQAGSLMYQSSDGVLNMPEDLPILTVDRIPTGLIKKGEIYEECVRMEDIDNARREAFLEAGVPLTTRSAIIVNGDPTCKEDWAAWATRSPDGAKTTIYNSRPDKHLIGHEEGHAAGLNHASTITCSIKQGDDYLAQAAIRSRMDIKTLLTTNECSPPLNKEGKINEYTSTDSVMGDKQPTKNNSDLYNFVEVNQLSPDTMKIESVDVIDASYTLGITETDVRGIKFELPPDHPLKKVDPSLTSLNVGLQESDRGVYNIRVIASGEDASYELSYIYPIAPKSYTKNIIYTDTRLGVQISAETMEERDIDKAVLHVEAIPQ